MSNVGITFRLEKTTIDTLNNTAITITHFQNTFFQLMKDKITVNQSESTDEQV